LRPFTVVTMRTEQRATPSRTVVRDSERVLVVVLAPLLVLAPLPGRVSVAPAVT
jgi:hypothetical protein